MSHADAIKTFVPKGGAVLDVGSGKGTFLADMAVAGFKAFGVEVYPPYVDAARETAAKRGLSVTILSGVAEKLPFEQGSFDFVNCAEVTEHVEDPAQALGEIARVLKTGGKAYISFHNRFGFYDYHYHLFLINWMPRFLTEPVLQLLGKQKEDGGAGRQKLVTMHYYTFSVAARMLRTIGFTATDIREAKIRKRFGSFTFLALIPYRLIMRPLFLNSFHFLVTKP